MRRAKRKTSFVRESGGNMQFWHGGICLDDYFDLDCGCLYDYKAEAYF